MQKRVDFFFLNIGHFFDHFFILIFATAAALVLAKEWGLSYAELIPYATPGFIAFGLGAIPAGWLADKWSRKGMMVIFFIGIGGATALTAMADTPFAMGCGLLAVGAFAAIYHPVGIALVVETHERTGVALAVNGVFGNLGVASAALVTALFIDTLGWRWPSRFRALSPSPSGSPIGRISPEPGRIPRPPRLPTRPPSTRAPRCRARRRCASMP